jgi:hypothetical protein
MDAHVFSFRVSLLIALSDESIQFLAEVFFLEGLNGSKTFFAASSQPALEERT